MFKEKVKKEIEIKPVDFGKFTLKTKTNDKYLGQVLESDLSTSALATVKDKASRVKGATMEIKSIIEDYQMQAMGGLVAAWTLWERALVPSLLSGAGTWLGDIREAVKLCNSIQAFFWRVMLNVPESCPKLALRCETKTTDMKWRVWEEKCLLLVSIKSLEDKSLAKSMYQQAEDNGWPGLGREVKEICKEINIPDINQNIVRKCDIQKAISVSHHQDMMAQFQGS